MTDNYDQTLEEFKAKAHRRQQIAEAFELLGDLLKVGCTLTFSLGFFVFCIWIAIQILEWMGAIQ
jgi:hypothetical protein